MSMIDKANNTASQLGTSATLEASLTRALEHAPAIAVPADFAARVRASLPAQPRTQSRPSAARMAATGAASAALLALCLLAPHAAPNFQSMSFDMELALLGELAVVAAWLAIRRGSV
jgi:hypothetical protein